MKQQAADITTVTTTGAPTWKTTRSATTMSGFAGGLGGNVRVGMEDSLWLGRGEPPARSNTDQAWRLRRVLAELSLEIATPDEACEALQTKGKNKVNIQTTVH